MPSLRPSSSATRRGIAVLPLLLGALGCSSNSTTSSGTDAGLASFSPGFHPGDAAVSTSASGSAGTTEESSGSNTGTTATTGESTATTTSSGQTGETTTTTQQATSSSTMETPSSGVVITVIPDGTGVAQGLLTAMENAKVAVHMEMYLLTNSSYVSALESLSKKIDVKVVLNQTFPSGTSASQTNAGTYTTLTGAGVNVHWAPTNTGFDSYTHEKAVIIDPGSANEQVWVMTMNLDTDAPKYNREYLAQDTNSADIAEAEAIFEADYADMDITPKGNLVVAPSPQNNATSVLLGLINGATTSIDVEAEEFDDSGQEAQVFNALTAAAGKGIAVHLVLEDSTVSSQASAVSSLQSAGGKVVGYVYGGTALDIHAKALVADGARAYVGSENFSGGSLGYNRELGVYFSEASEVAKVESTIQMDFAGGSTYSSQ